MSRIARSWMLMGLVVAACATTSFVSSWRSPTARPLQLKGAKVAAVVMVKEMPTRKAAEDRLAREITQRGAKGVALYTILPDAKAEDEDKVRAALAEAKFEAAVVMRPVGAKQQVHVTAQPGYDRFYGGYYGYGWGASWSRDTRYEVHTDTIVSVESRVYSLEQNQLVWAGQSKTTNPENVDDFVVELAAAVADELNNQGLIQH